MEITFHGIVCLLTSSLLNSLLCLFFGFGLNQKKILLIVLGAIVASALKAPDMSFVPGLQNVLAYIHPLVILFFYSKFSQQYIYFFNKKHITLNFVCGFFLTLFLGGWGAFQEYTGGGGGNGDLIEVPALIVGVYVANVNFHLNLKLRNIFEKNIRTGLTLIVIAVSITRYANVSSVHSFISAGLHYNVYYFVVFLILGFNAFLLIFKYPVSLLFLKNISWLMIVLGLNSFMFNAKSRGKTTSNFNHIVFAVILVNLACTNVNYLEIFKNSNSNSVFCKQVLLWVKPTTFYYNYNFAHLTYLIN